MQADGKAAEALKFLGEKYADARVNNNISIVGNIRESVVISENYVRIGMKQSYFKNIRYEESFFTNVALTGSKFDSVEFSKCNFNGSSLANCNFYNVGITGNGSPYNANNLSLSDFENCRLKLVEFTQTGVLSALFHNCKLTEVTFRGSTLEETQFISCEMKNCDFGHVNLDYTLFSNNNYIDVVFPFYQTAYIIGAADFLNDPKQFVKFVVGDREINKKEYLSQVDNLIYFYLDKNEYFPVCNIYLVKKDFVSAKQYLLEGITRYLLLKDLRMISNLCRLAKYHGIIDESVKSKIFEEIDKFIQSDEVPDTQLNFYLIYIERLKALLNSGAHNSLTVKYTINTDVDKSDKNGLKYVNRLVKTLNKNLAGTEGVNGFNVSLASFSPCILSVDVVLSAIRYAPLVIASVIRIVSTVKKIIRMRKAKEIDNDLSTKYLDERIERARYELLNIVQKCKSRTLNKHITDITQSLKTDLEEFYTKDVMLFKLVNKKKKMTK